MVECSCGKEFEGEEIPYSHIEECPKLIPSPVYTKQDVKEKFESTFNADEIDEQVANFYEEGFIVGWQKAVEFIEKYEEEGVEDLERTKNHLKKIRESFKGEF